MARQRRDLTGQKFGKLTVMRFAGYRHNNRQRVAVWECQCDCGNICQAEGSILCSGRKKSCGCIRIASEHLSGMRFGKLTVLGEDTDDHTTLRKVICRCDCGKELSVAFRNLKSGKTRSCGCDRTAIYVKNNFLDRNFDEGKEQICQMFRTGLLSGSCFLEDWVYVWLKEIQSKALKPSTLMMYGETMKRHVFPALGKLTLEQITEEKVQEWVNDLRRNPVPGSIDGKLTEGTVRNVLSVLSGCMRDAQKHGLIKKNPCQEVAWVPARENVWEGQRWLDDDEIARLELLLMECRGQEGYPLWIGYQLILHAGLSMSEAVALRWKNVHPEQGILTVEYFAVEQRIREVSNEEEPYLEQVAGRRKREVPIPDFLMDMLTGIRNCYGCTGEEFVVNASSKEPARMDRMRSALFKRGKSAGIDRVTPRMLRDTYAMRAVRAGATSDMIAELMGFASPQQVLRRYMPKTATDKRELVKRMYGKSPCIRNINKKDGVI